MKRFGHKAALAALVTAFGRRRMVAVATLVGLVGLAIGTSAFVAFWVALLSVAVGTCNAFLFERNDFPGKRLLYVLMLIPLVIPGIILGISILVFSSRIATCRSSGTGRQSDRSRNVAEAATVPSGAASD